MSRTIDCKKCLHEKVCDLWTRQESQDASCFCSDGCDYFEPTLTPTNEPLTRAGRHQYTRQELEQLTAETAIYIEGAGIAQLQWGGLEIAEGVRDGYLYCKHIKPFAMDLYDKYWTAWDGPPEKDYKQATNADRIRAMSNEKLAILLCRMMDCSICKRNIQKDGECDNYSADGLSKAVLNWLQRPAEEDT